MLIKYDYELLSYLALKGIRKVNGDIVISLKKIRAELLEEDIASNLQNLEFRDIIEISEDRIIIKIDQWIDFFILKLSEKFKHNDMEVKCEKEVIKNSVFYQYSVRFLINGASKVFKLIFNNSNEKCEDDEHFIFMCKTNVYKETIYWLDLINDRNLLNQFYEYLVNEISNINKCAYRKLDIFDGIDDKYINEIFYTSIKQYFLNRKFEIKEFDKDQCKIIEKVFAKDNLNYYGIEINGEILWLIKDKKKIIFITIKNNELTYSNKINEEINNLQDKICNKISEFNSLTLFKENNVIDSTVKTVSKIGMFFMPTSLIISILSFMNIKIDNIINFKTVLIVCIIVLSIIQFYLARIVYLPIFKINRFRWKIK